MSEQEPSIVAGRAPYDVAIERAAAKGSQPAAPAGDGLDDKTKDELLVVAEERGVEVRTSASKAEILAVLRG